MKTKYGPGPSALLAGSRINRGPVSRRRSHFTLVELLVVIAVIAMLVAILLPSLNRARESANVVVCANNLKELGVAAHMHAEDKDGWFPQTMRNNEACNYGPYGYLRYWRIGDVDDDGQVDAPNVDVDFSDDTWVGDEMNPTDWHRNYDCAQISTAWKHYGTPWSAWQSYGVVRETLVCPSSTADDLTLTVDVRSGENPAVKGAYAWVTGAQYCWQGETDVGRMGERVPAMKSNESKLDKRPLAADIVRWGATNNAGWADKYREVNHGELPGVSTQNIVFGDGHIEEEKEYYRSGLNALRNNYQYNRWNSGAQFVLWFWGNGQ